MLGLGLVLWQVLGLLRQTDNKAKRLATLTICVKIKSDCCIDLFANKLEKDKI